MKHVVNIFTITKLAKSKQFQLVILKLNRHDHMFGPGDTILDQQNQSGTYIYISEQWLNLKVCIRVCVGSIFIRSIKERGCGFANWTSQCLVFPGALRRVLISSEDGFVLQHTVPLDGLESCEGCCVASVTSFYFCRSLIVTYCFLRQ